MSADSSTNEEATGEVAIESGVVGGSSETRCETVEQIQGDHAESTKAPMDIPSPTASQDRVNANTLAAYRSTNASGRCPSAMPALRGRSEDERARPSAALRARSAPGRSVDKASHREAASASTAEIDKNDIVDGACVAKDTVAVLHKGDQSLPAAPIDDEEEQVIDLDAESEAIRARAAKEAPLQNDMAANRIGNLEPCLGDAVLSYVASVAENPQVAADLVAAVAAAANAPTRAREVSAGRGNVERSTVDKDAVVAGLLENLEDEPPSLMRDIRTEFKRCCGESSSQLSVEDLARYWLHLAEEDRQRKGRHRMNGQEKQAIALRASQLLQEMDLTDRGYVEIQDWMHYMLMACCSIPLKQVNALLEVALQRNARVLTELQKLWCWADTSRCGSVTLHDITDAYRRRQWRYGPNGSRLSDNDVKIKTPEVCAQKLWLWADISRCGSVTLQDVTDAYRRRQWRYGPNGSRLSDNDVKIKTPEVCAQKCFEEMDSNGDQRVTYAEFMAYSLGRRKHEVVLHLYDLSNGSAKKISPYVIGRELEGVWHTGTVVYEKEYYYSKDTVYADPGDTSFGQPHHIVHLGYTLWRQDELHEFVSRELKPIFQRETYDVVCNNCNHFTDRVLLFLVGKHCPEEVLCQPKFLMDSRSVRVIRPLLNWWLRDRIVVREAGFTTMDGVRRLRPGEQPPLGHVVSIHQADGSTVLAQVCTPNGEQHHSINSVGNLASSSVAGAVHDETGLSATGAVSSDFRSDGFGFGGSIIRCDGAAGGLVGCDAGWPGGSVFFSTCGLTEKSEGAAGAQQHVGRAGGNGSLDGVWVQYFELQPQSSGSSRCQVRTELVPYSQLSLGGLNSSTLEAWYRRALRVMSSNSESRHSAASELSVHSSYEDHVAPAGPALPLGAGGAIAAAAAATDGQVRPFAVVPNRRIAPQMAISSKTSQLDTRHGQPDALSEEPVNPPRRGKGALDDVNDEVLSQL